MDPTQDTLFTALLAPLDAAPEGQSCGPDLEYAPRFLDFIANAQGKPEQQLGSSIIPAQDPDWRAVFKQGMALASESKDLRIAAVLVHAATQLHGLRGLADGLALIHAWLTGHWDGLHPPLVVEGERDPLMRMNALASLADPQGCLKAVRQSGFLNSRIGTLSIGEAEALLKGRPAADNAVVTSTEQLERLLSDERERNAGQLVALADAAQGLAAIEALWHDRVEADYWPELDALRDLLARLESLCAHVAPQSGPAAVPDAALPSTDQNAPLIPGQAATPAATLPEHVANRSDAFKALAIARSYFERHEPSHPAPLLIRRIEKLADMGFAEILAELAPDALGQLRGLTGSSD